MFEGLDYFWIYNVSQNQVATIDKKIKVLEWIRVPLIDQSGLYTLEDIVFDLEQLGTQVLLVNLQSNPWTN
jgi:SulP family sulfate permease